MRSARAPLVEDEPLVVVSVDDVVLFDEEDELSLFIELEPVVPLEPVVLPVPLAPMLDVLGLEELLAVLLELELGLVELEVELLGVLLVEPVALLVLGVVLFVDEALVPPAPDEPDEPELPLDCAMAKPPMASAAAAANVVSVFLVVVMSFAP